MASTTDLTNPIRLPNGIDTSNNNPIGRSDKIIRQGQGKNVESSLTGLESTQIAYTFNTGVTDTTDPGSGFMALNNTDKDAATIATFSTTSANNSARFDEVLNNLTTGDRIYLQERDTPGTNILYRITAATTLTGTRVNVPIAREQDQGTASGTFTNNNDVVLTILFTRTVSASGLPQPQADWLAQTSSQQLSTTTVTNIAPIVTDVLIWRRAAIVQQADIGEPDIGLVIAEANRQSDGTFDRASGTSVYDDDLSNAYIYIAITTSNFNNDLDTANTFLEARRDGALIFSSSLDNLTTPVVSISQFVYRRTTNNQYHYVAGDTLEVVTRATSSTTEFNYNSPAGDFTANIDDLPFTAVNDQFAVRVNGSAENQELTAADRVKLTGLLVNTTTTTGQNLTVLYKEGLPSSNIADYTETWNTSNPVLANFGATRIISVLVTNNVNLTSVTGGGVIGPQLLFIPGHYIYQVTLPAESSTGTPTSHLPVGLIHTFLPTGFNDNYKIDRGNVEASLLALIDAHGTSADISSLETKLNNLVPLTPDVDILINWSNIYDPIHGAATVDIVDGYSLIADYRSGTQKYESAGVTFGTGTDVITYTGLSDNLHRSFGFVLPQSSIITLTGTSGTANITVNGTDYLVTFNTNLSTTASDFVTTHATALSTAGVTVSFAGAILTFVSSNPSVLFTITDAVNATGNLAGTATGPSPADKTLMWIVDGSTNIPFVDVTSAGNIRVNNYTPAEEVSTRVDNQANFLTRTSGSQIVTTADGSLATFTIPNFPSGATEQLRSLQIGIDVYQQNTDTQAEHLENISIPATNVNQSIQTFDASIQLGPLYGNRTVVVTIGYTFRVDGANMLVDLTLEAAPSGIRVSFDRDTIGFLSYTAQSITARVDNFLNLNDAAGDYTFTGQQEFILSMRPVIGGDGEQTGFLEVVPAAVGADGDIDQLNDTDVRIPTPLWDGIQVADDIGFKTFVADHYFRHSEVAGFLQHRTEQWAYGIARLQTINAGHSFREAVDLASGSTIGGSPIGPGTVQAELVVYEATGKGTGAGELVSSVVLPANYATYRYVHVTEYDSSSLQFRHAEFPTYILSAGLVDTNDNVRLQGNTVLAWTAGTRTLAMNPVAQEILRVSLKD